MLIFSWIVIQVLSNTAYFSAVLWVCLCANGGYMVYTPALGILGSIPGPA